MEGSTNTKGSERSAYPKKDKGLVYELQNKDTFRPIYKSRLNYLSKLDSGRQYNPVVPLGYSKQGSGKDSKGPYFEMAGVGFYNPFNQVEETDFNICDVCNSPIPKIARRCVNCSLGVGDYKGT